MASSTEFATRLQLCREIAADRGLDALLVIGKGPERGGDLLYLTNHKPILAGHVTLYNFRGRGYGALLIPLEDDPVLVATTPFYEKDIAVTEVKVSSDFPFMIGEVITAKRLSRSIIGLVGEDVLTVTLYKDLFRHLPQAQFIKADDIIMNLRAIKSEWEIQQLRQGAKIADEVSESLRSFIRGGLKETEVTAFIIRELSERGVKEAFATCQSGIENSGEPMIHGGATDRVLRNGDMVHMEINGKIQGYMIDVCRSTVIGQPSRQQAEVLELVLQMLETSASAMKPGIAAEELERITGRLALDHGYIHHHTIAYGGPGTYLGHGIGLGIDEPPIIAEGMKTIIREGMVITLEPGIYRTDVGGARIEDEILVTSDGTEVLNTYDRKWW